MVEKLIYLDFETTGLSKFTDRIIEVAAIHFKDGKIDDSYVTLVNPKIQMVHPATKKRPRGPCWFKTITVTALTVVKKTHSAESVQVIKNFGKEFFISLNLLSSPLLTILL